VQSQGFFYPSPERFVMNRDDTICGQSARDGPCCGNAKQGFSGIVYHANYLRFMERGRTNYLRLLGADQHALFTEAQAEAPGFAFVVRAMQIDYLKPARMDDILEIMTSPLEVKGASITLAQQVRRRGQDVLVEAQVRVAFVSDGRARPMPKALRIAMQADQANP
jgi:acyl-CoA thioester hydrolase